MSVTNLGTQTINWKYKTSLKGSNLSKMFNGCISPGIYLNNNAYITSGTGLVTSFTGNQITINAFTAVFKASSTQTVTISTAAPIMLSTDGGLGYITASAPYITMSYTWADQIINYIDFAFKASGDITANDIVIGKAMFTMGSVTSINYSEASYPMSYDYSNRINLLNSPTISKSKELLPITITTADVTLSDRDASYDGFILSGTLTGIRNLILPNTRRSYRVINNCSGSYYVYIKTAAGTGCYLIGGDIATIYCDGTNILKMGLEKSSRAVTGASTFNTSISSSYTKITGYTVDSDCLSEWDSVNQGIKFKQAGTISLMSKVIISSATGKISGDYYFTLFRDNNEYRLNYWTVQNSSANAGYYTTRELNYVGPVDTNTLYNFRVSGNQTGDVKILSSYFQLHYIS